MLYVAECYSNTGQYKLAVDTIWKALELEPDNGDLYFVLGTNYVKLASYDEAISAFNNVARIQPENYKAHYNLGIIFAVRGWSEEAMLSLKRCLSIKPDYEPAIQKLTEFNTNLMAAYPDDVQPYIDLGDGLRIAGKYEEAIPYLEQARTKAPDNTEMYYLLGQCYSRIGRYDTAVELLTAALAAKADDYGALLELAKTYEAMGDAEKTKKSYLALTKLKSDDYATYRAVGDYYLRTDNTGTALTYYEKGLALDPSDYAFWADTALIYARENKKLERGKKLAERSLVLKADNPLGTKALGYIYYRMKNYSEAKKYLTAAGSMLPEDTEITELLGAIAEKGDTRPKPPPVQQSGK